MSLNLNIPCNDTKKEIGIFNHLKVIYMPVGVSVMVSFKDTPKDNELYPLTDIVADMDSSGEMIENARRCWLHITGTSTEDIKLIASNVTKDGGYIDVKQKETIALEDSTKSVIESLDKIINPYENDLLVTSGGTSTTGLITILSKTLTSDKIKVSLLLNSSSNADWAKLYALIDGSICLINYRFTYDGKTVTGEFEGVRGKTLEIRSDGSDAGTNFFYLEEYTLKP